MTSQGFPPTLVRYFDWDKFPQTSHSSSTEQLAACSKIGINTDTLKLVQHLCNYYPIPEARKQECAQGFKTFTDFIFDDDRKSKIQDDIYWLFKLTRELAFSESGVALLCICNVLANHYTVESIVAIFTELTKETGVPEDLVPSTEAWQSLKPLFGSFGGQPMFRALVDKFTGLGNSTEAIDRPGVGHLSADGVVSSFTSMSFLGRGEQEWLLFLVGKDAGWVCAVAEWLFGLRVELRGSFQEDKIHGEKVLYSSCGDGMKPQLVIRFNPAGVPVDGAPIVDIPLEVKG